jgi:HEAT repeat protein
MKTVDQSVRYTVDKTASISLYQPLPAEKRMQVQTALESIIEPVIGGVSGLLLALMMHVLGFGTRSIVTTIVVVAVVWVVLVVIQDRHYQKALRRAIIARRLGEGQVSIVEPGAIAVIVSELSSSSTGRVLNALGLIHKIEGFDCVDCYQRLMIHPAEAVRFEVMRLIESLGEGGFDPALISEQLERETYPLLRAAAVRALIAVDSANASSNLLPLVSDCEESVRLEAFIGLLKHGGTEAVEHATQTLLAALQSTDPMLRSFSARVLEHACPPRFKSSLALLLHDEDPTVRCTALHACEDTDQDILGPHVAKLLSDSSAEVRLAAEGAIARCDDAFIGLLADLLLSSATPLEVQRSTTRVLARIDSPAARHCLLSGLAVPDRRINQAALFALVPMQNPDDYETRVLTELQALIALRAWEVNQWRTALDKLLEPGIEPVLQRALADQLDMDRKCIFHIIALLHPKIDLRDAWTSYQSDDLALRAIAVEIVEMLLHPDVRLQVLALLERYESPVSHVTQGTSQAEPGESSVLHKVLEAPASEVTPWTRAAALYTLINTKGEMRGVSPVYTTAPVYAELIQSQSTSDQAQGRYRPMLIIEKILILRNTPIFQSVKEEQLLDVAERAELVELEEGAVLFAQGEMGQALFVLVEGRIKVHSDDTVLAQLGPGEVVGEMAALDPEPRSASVTAIEPSLLLRVSNQNLQLLINQNPNVARGIIKLLCSRLRKVQVTAKL